MGCVEPGEEEEEDDDDDDDDGLSKSLSVSLNEYLNNPKWIAITH